MLNTLLVSIVVTGGAFALVGVPWRAWQLATGRLRARVPPHPTARATFSLFSIVFFAPAVLAWAYAFWIAFADLSCAGPCAGSGAGTAFAVGMLGCAYALLEGFLLTARRPAA